MSQPLKVTYNRREVLDNKLLTALSRDDTVAALFTKSDMDLMIKALTCAADHPLTFSAEEIENATEFARDLKRLSSLAFTNRNQ